MIQWCIQISTEEQHVIFKILWKLFHQGCWGKGHIAKRDICKGLPPEQVALCFNVLEDLRKANMVRRKRHKHGDPYRYFLNRNKYKEILDFLEKFGEAQQGS